MLKVRLIRNLLSTSAALGVLLGIFTMMPGLTPSADAATCGGNIVAKAGNYKGHNAIWVDTGPNPKRTPPITKIQYWNGRSNETVANADNGVKYNTPIGQEGKYFVYGVSTRWTWGWGHGDWKQSWRWRVFYNC